MHRNLDDDRSYCQVEEHLIFLDIGTDRYFRLPESLERAFVAYMTRENCSNAEVATLRARGVLPRDARERQEATLDVEVQRASRSVVEQRTDGGDISTAELLEVLGIVLSMKVQLRRRKLRKLLSSLNAYRHRKATPRALTLAGQEHALTAAASAFLRTRLYLPFETSCLLDSLAMVRFLARRGLYAHLVFGVVGTPFSAHCWAQACDWVLNDTVGNVNAHTPIRVV